MRVLRVCRSVCLVLWNFIIRVDLEGEGFLGCGYSVLLSGSGRGLRCLFY